MIRAFHFRNILRNSIRLRNTNDRIKNENFVWRHSARLLCCSQKPLSSKGGSKDNSENSSERQEDYIDENAELEKILRDLYSEPDGDERNFGSLSYQKFRPFEESGGRVIYDIDEERQLRLEDAPDVDEVSPDDVVGTSGITDTRGAEGVFEVEELVEVLRRERCSDICVVRVPPEKNYASQIVIATCTSSRHVVGVADFVKKVFKLKRTEKDAVPRLEGRNKSTDWIAADMGNIVLHLFLKKTREKYDLESLWVLGSEFDEQSQVADLAEDEIFNSDLLSDLRPATK